MDGGAFDDEAILRWNRGAWDRQVARGNRWTRPVAPDAVAAARRGEVAIVLTPTRTVPREWFPPLVGLPTLCLAASGGQQAPLLAAAGAQVTVHDLSPAQLAQDRSVAGREGLELRLEQGDMRDLSRYPDGAFGLIVHPCANGFVPDPAPVWREAFRVLAPGGVLLAGFLAPHYHLFDEPALERGELLVRHALPYSDLLHLDAAQRARLAADDEPLLFGHTLEQQIGGQLAAGLVLTALYEDVGSAPALDARIATSIATRAVKPAG